MLKPEKKIAVIFIQIMTKTVAKLSNHNPRFAININSIKVYDWGSSEFCCFSLREYDRQSISLKQQTSVELTLKVHS